MTGTPLGVCLALGTAGCWCFSAISFEEAGRRAGSVPVNLIRLWVALGLLTVAAWISRGMAVPVDATRHQWTFLLWSGFVGFFIGDVTGFRALVLIGARMTAVVSCSAAIFALVAEQFLLPEAHVGGRHVAGVVVTLAGVALVVSEKRGAHPAYRVTGWGLLLAFVGAAGQGVGLVLTTRGRGPGPGLYDLFATGQIRAIAGVAAFSVFVVVTGRTRDVMVTLRRPAAMGFLTLGAFGGPFVGVTLLIAASGRVPPSLAQAVASLAPVLIIPVSVIFRGEKVSVRAIVGAAVSVVGVWILTGAGDHR